MATSDLGRYRLASGSLAAAEGDLGPVAALQGGARAFRSSGRRDGRVRDAGRVRIRQGRRAVGLAVESPLRVGHHINRHVWELLCGRGCCLGALRMADEERFNQAALFCLGAGAATAGVLFRRDPPGPHAPRWPGAR